MKELRLKFGLTQAEFAILLACPLSQIAMQETYKRTLPTALIQKIQLLEIVYEKWELEKKNAKSSQKIINEKFANQLNRKRRLAELKLEKLINQQDIIDVKINTYSFIMASSSFLNEQDNIEIREIADLAITILKRKTADKLEILFKNKILHQLKIKIIETEINSINNLFE